MGEERRLVTVLFADIVGSTAFAGEHDPEVVRAALLGTFAALRTIIERHGGVVEKFAGDEVMAVFGAPIAHEDDADRAVRTALAIRAAAATRGGRGGAPRFELRIGLNTGEVLSGGDGSEFLVTGQAVNAAARVRQAASPGEILTGELTHALTASTVTYDDAREFDAKGIGRMRAWPVTGLATAMPVRPLSRAGRLVGRDAELELLRSVEGRGEGPRTHLVTLLGPTGIGKSRLIAEFADRAGDTRVRVGHCLAYGEAVAFWPLREVVYAEAGIDASDTKATALDKLARAIAETGATGTDADAVARRLAVLTGLSTKDEAMPDEPPPNLAQELRWGLRRFLEWRTALGPLVIVIEDLHWGDPALLDALDYVAEWAEGRLLLICVSTPELLEARPRWSADRANALTVKLHPLGTPDALALVDALDAGAAFAPDVRDEIVERAEGNPLFIEELVRTVAALPGLGAAADPRAAVRRALPPTLHGLIAARIDRLPVEVREVMKRAAVAGGVFSTAGLAAFGGDDPGYDDLVAAAVRHDLVVATDEPALGTGTAYRFRHSLIRDVVYNAIPKSQRWRMHDAFGRWIEAACRDRVAEHADLIAFHAERACATALELGEPSAAELGERALALLLAGATRWRRAGMLRAALGLYDRAVALGEQTDAAAAALVEARGFGALSRFYVDGARAALDRLDEALAAARAAGPSEVLVRLASQRAFMARLESLETSGALFAEAIAAARALGDPTLLAHAMLMSNAQPWMIGDLDEQRRVLNDADTIMTASGSTAERGIALAWLGTNALQRGEFSSAASYLERSEELARASGSRFQQWAAARAAARDALMMGDRDRALALAESALGFAKEVGARRIVALSQIRLGDVLYEAGDLARSRSVLEEALGVLDRQTMSETSIEAQWKLSRTCLASGDLAAARRYAEAAVAAVGKNDLYSMVTTKAALAAVQAASGDHAGAERLLRESLELAERTGYRALAADGALALGSFLADRGRSEEAKPLLERARSFYSDDLTHRRRAEIDRLLSGSATAV